MRREGYLLGLSIVVAHLLVSGVLAQAFTFQGYLRQNNNPVNGTLSMTFTLFNHPTNTTGAQVGSPITQNVTVQNGLFSVELNFGNVWDGSDRWLQIQVGSQVLSPRVKINPAPYAIRAATAGTANPIGTAGGDLSGSYPNPTVARLQGRAVASTAPSVGQVLKWDGSQWAPAPDLQGNTFWQASGSNIFYNAGNVGIGTSDPFTRLHVETSSSSVAIYGYHTATTGFAYGVYGRSDSPDGYGGYFVGRGYFEHNSDLNRATLRLHENESEFARLEFTNTNTTRKWHIAGLIGSTPAADRLNFWNSRAGDILSLSGDGSVAVGAPSLYTAQLNVSVDSDLNRATLRLHEAANDGARLEFTNANPARKWHIAAYIGIASGNDASADSIVFWNSATGNLMRVLGNGNVGIGTDSPIYRLHVVQTGSSDRAIFGHYTATTGLSFGVYGRNDSNEGRGVFGLASATTGTTMGVFGRSDSTSGYGVYGIAIATTGRNFGVYGATQSSDGRGVYGYAAATTGATVGVYGDSDSPNGYGVYSSGRFAATGTKNFQIDHPLRPETHFLNHFSAEGPEPYNIYRGTVVLDARGEAWVQLPDYFEAINRDPAITLTPVGAPMPNLHVAVEVQGNRFKIAGGLPNHKVFWRVEAVRNDLWVQRYGYETEQEKPKEYQGKYLHPELYGQPKERGIFYHPTPEPAERVKP